MRKFILFTVVAVFGATAMAETPNEIAFAKMKALVGTWRGQAFGNDFEVTYKLIGAGSAVTETYFAGTPTEMLTVYHMDKSRLVLTHYCASGNQPSLKFVPGKDSNKLSFKFDHGSNMKLTDSHMHDLTIYLKGTNQIASVWQGWAKGKLDHTAKFEMKRQAK